MADDAVGADPIHFRQWDLVEGFALIVLPERNARRTPMCKGEVHPAVMVEIEDSNADGRPWYPISPWDTSKRTLPGIFENHWRLAR